MINELLDAFNYGLGSIDKLGPRPLRGLLAGKPREALSLLPFSDASGITDPKDIQTGRNVTDKLGLTNPTDPGWGAWGTGLAADVALDPLALYGGAKAGLKGLSAGLGHLSSRTMPGENVIHHLAGLLGDTSALERSAKHLNPAERILWKKENTKGALGLINPFDYQSMIKDESNPLGRLSALAESAGSKIWPDASNIGPLTGWNDDVGKATEQFHRAIRKRAYFGYGNPLHSPHAIASTEGVIPNIIDRPEMWSDLGLMAKEMAGQRAPKGRNKNWLATGLPEQVGIHEIGHDLHRNALADAFRIPEHQQLGSSFGVGLPPLLPMKWGEGELDQLRPLIEKHISRYASSTPAEFIAEAFAKRAKLGAEHGTDLGKVQELVGRWLPPKLLDRYNLEHGPMLPEGLIAKLAELLERGLR